MPGEEIIAVVGSATGGILINAGWDLIKALLNHCGIKDYLSFKAHEVFGSQEPLSLYAYSDDSSTSGDQKFWQMVSRGQLLEGTKIELLNFQVSPWFPRKPGTYWTYEASLARKKAFKHHIEGFDDGFIVFDAWGKTIMSELGGIGSLNIRKNRDTALFTLTASGYTDRGIPMVCPPSIWNEINKELTKCQRVEVDLKGTICSIPLEYDSFLMRSSNIPKVAVSVDSILNIEVKQSDLSIIVTPWTIFESSDVNAPYAFTYKTHDLKSNDLNTAVDWIKRYVDQHEGTAILTDFDEEINSLNAIFPLDKCMSGLLSDRSILSHCQQISRKFRKDYA